MSSALAKSYLTFTREEQRLVGVSAKQAPVLMSPQLNKLIPHMRMTARSGHTPGERISITRDIALFCVAFHTCGRGFDLARTLGAQVVRLPEGAGHDPRRLMCRGNFPATNRRYTPKQALRARADSLL